MGRGKGGKSELDDNGKIEKEEGDGGMRGLEMERE